MKVSILTLFLFTQVNAKGMMSKSSKNVTKFPKYIIKLKEH